MLFTRIMLTILALALGTALYTLVGMQPLLQAEILAHQSPMQAAEASLQALEYFPWRVELYEQAGNYMLQAGQPTRAIELYTQARASGSLSRDGSLALGDAYWQLGELEQAVSEWQTLANGSQPAGRVFSSLARAYHQQGAYEDELTAITQGLVIQPLNADLNTRYAILLMSTSPTDAIPALEHAAALDPAAASRLTSFMFTLTSALRTDNLAYQLTTSGQALAEDGDWPLAQRAFENAARANPRYAPAWTWLGQARQQTGTPGALEALNQALRLTPTDPGALSMRGLYYQQHGDYPRALADYQLAVAADPQNIIWQMALGDVYDRIGNLNGALLAYQTATESAPADPQTWRALALFCLSRDIFIEELAFPAAKKALELDPGNPLSLDLLGQANMGLEKFSEAEILFKKAIATAPDDASPHFHLGLLYLHLGKLPDSELELRTTLHLDPSGQIGERARRILERYFP